MAKVIYTPAPDEVDNHQININADVLDTDMDDVDYSKYAVDDSDEEMANLLDY